MINVEICWRGSDIRAGSQVSREEGERAEETGPCDNQRPAPGLVAEWELITELTFLYRDQSRDLLGGIIVKPATHEVSVICDKRESGQWNDGASSEKSWDVKYNVKYKYCCPSVH